MSEPEDVAELIDCLDGYFSEYGSEASRLACLRVAERYGWDVSGAGFLLGKDFAWHMKEET